MADSAEAENLRSITFLELPTGVVGAAIFPYLMGQIANHHIAAAYYLPIICYAVIFLFGAKYYRVQPR